VREPHSWKAARRWLLWPAASVFVIATGAFAIMELSREGRSLAATTIVAALAGLAGAAASVLVTRLLTAQRLALRDPLTGLPNRALLEDRIEQALARSQRLGESFALLVVDLDGFKGVNDIRGHEAGNAVLCAIARRLESVVRRMDTVARVGGDEFVVLSLATGEDDEAAALVGRLRNALRRPYRVDGGLVELDASIGWAIFPQDGVTPTELLARADGQMYASKRDTSEESVLPRAQVNGSIVREVEAAFDQGEIVVHYQPIVHLQTGEIRAVEALVRRLRANRLVAPSEFLPHIERTPLVRRLTLAVAADALQQVQEWDSQGHRLDVAVNVPYRMLDDTELVLGLRALLQDFPIDPARLTLEVVPSGPGAGAALDAVTLRQLRDLGVKLSLDDLGRASSVAAIRTLPLDQVKIDAMFLHDVGRGGRADAIVRSLVELARELGLETVAEGVESRLAWDAASTLGCDLAQGFHFGHPMPAKKLSDWLSGSSPVVALTT
jgi:diguanylate cyclase